MNKIKYWFPSIILMILIFLGSNDPVSGEKSDFITRFIWKIILYITGYQANSEQELATSFIIRKIAHVTEYLLLTLSYYYALSKTSKNKKNFPKTYFIAFLLGLMYSISDEFHQTFIPGRVGTYKDVLVDSVGIYLGYLLLYKKK